MGELLGRLHPLIVHLPIGIIVLAFFMELASRREKFSYLKPSIKFILVIGILTSLISLFTGWIMPKEGAFDERLIGFHFWLSVGMSVSLLFTYLSHISSNDRFSKMYMPFLVLTLFLLTATGHFGGSLTHGEDFLTKPLGSHDTSNVSDVNSVIFYTGIIQPILKQKCYSCHNEGKKKGNFIMSTEEGLMKGGEEGVSIIPGDPIKSPLISRLHLPIEDENHMPPKGKKELSKNETTLLEWWIKTGSSFDKLVGEMDPPEEIAKILKTYEQNDQDPDPKGIDPLTVKDVESLVRQGIQVSAINDASPFIDVSLSRNKSVTKSLLKKLNKYSENINELDLSYSNVTDAMMSSVSSFPNITILKLQGTDITSKGLVHLQGLKFLKYLNVYNTDVDDDAFSSLTNIPSLSNIYLWQSKVSKEQVDLYALDHPRVNISHQLDASIFGDARLKPPLISASKDIFDDTLRVTLSLNFSKVNVYYTLDGSLPDSTSNKYEGPFLIEETASIKAISAKDGWETSEVNEQVYIKAGHAIASIKLEKQPSDKYKAKGAKSLIDFEKGSDSFVDGKWLGYEGENMKATLDLGSIKDVGSVVVGAMETTANYIFFPKGLVVSTSKTGSDFQIKKRLNIPIAEGPNPTELKSFLLEFDHHEAQYVQVEVLGTLKNPSWHGAPGAKNWIFIDEILVN